MFSTSGDEVLIGRKAALKLNNPSHQPTLLTWVPLDEQKSTQDFPIPKDESFRGVLQANRSVTWTDGKVGFAVKYTNLNTYKIGGYFPGTSNQVTLHQGQGDLSFSSQGSSETGSILGLFEDLHTLQNIFQFKESFQKRENLTQLNEQTSEVSSITVMRIGDTALLLPPNLKPGERPATVVFGYPGRDLSRYADYFSGGDPASGSIPSEILIRSGYAVALPNLPMNEEGKAGEPIQEMTAALLPQIESLAKSGLVDPKRFALIGQSYGGYMAAAVPTATSRFKASIAVSGTFDLMADYGFLDQTGNSPWIQWAESGQGPNGWAAMARPKTILEKLSLFPCR